MESVLLVIHFEFDQDQLASHIQDTAVKWY